MDRKDNAEGCAAAAFIWGSLVTMGCVLAVIAIQLDRIADALELAYPPVVVAEKGK